VENYSFSVFPNENFLDLRLYQYGWEQCAPLHSFGPYVRNHYLIYMMVEDTNPAVTSVQSLMYLFYRESFVAGSRGSGSAIVIWTVLLIGAVTIIQFVGQKKWVNYDV